jgi:predicted RNA-binding protein YlxR (DUF448 family)
MGKHSRRRKHVPQRICVACRTAQPKRDLVRIVRTPEGTVLVDETGKHKGRGAYICRQRTCWEAALTRRQLDRALRVTITAEAAAQLRQYATTLPELLAGESEDSEKTVEGVSV